MRPPDTHNQPSRGGPAPRPERAALLVVLLLTTAAVAARARATLAAVTPQEMRPAAETIPPEARLPWKTRVEDAVQEAAAQKKLVLVYFRDNFQPCRLLEEGPFAAPKFGAYLQQHFLLVRVDDSGGKTPATTRFKVKVYPTILILDAEGKPLHVILGPRSAGGLHATLEQVRMLPDLMATQKANPDDREANFRLGNALVRLNDLRRAQPYLDRAAELDPDNAHGRLAQATLLLALLPIEDGLADEALKNLDQWVQRFGHTPEMPTALYFKGTVLYGDRRLAEARKVFEDLCRRFPKHAMAYKAEKAIRAIDARRAAAPPPKEQGGQTIK